jgi:hypothetical protein
VAILVDKITARVERMEDRHQDNAVFHAQVLATKEELGKMDARTTAVEVSQIKTDTTVKVVTNSVRGAWAALSLAVLGGAFKLFGLHPV